MTASRSQSTYQVRLGWGADGVKQLAESGIVVVVDAIGAEGQGSARDLAEAAAKLPHAPTVYLASLRNATATADAVYREQIARGERTSINLVLVGTSTSTRTGGTGTDASTGTGGFAVEDYLAAGAVANALSERGLDHSAPDVAVAIEGFRSLKRALKHLFSASAAGLAAAEAGRRDEVRAAALLDADEDAIRYGAS